MKANIRKCRLNFPEEIEELISFLSSDAANNL